MSSVGKKLNINFSRSKAIGPGGKGKKKSAEAKYVSIGTFFFRFST